MTTLYLRDDAVNWTDANSWSTTSATVHTGAATPTAADDCIAELLSGNVTVNSGSVCRSFNTTSGTGSWAGVLTHSASVTWSIGDGTAGAGNVAFKSNSGLTYTIGSGTTSILAFVSTSGTQQTVTFVNADGFMPPVSFTGVGGSWQFQDNYTGVSTTLTHTAGTLDVNGKSIDCAAFNGSGSTTRTLTMGASTASFNTGSGGTAWSFSNATGLTFNANTSTINFTGGSSARFFPGAKTFNVVNSTGSGTLTVDGAGTFGTLTRTGTAVKTDSISLVGNITVTGTLTLAGNSATNRLLVTSSVIGTARTVTNSGATMTWSNVDFRDITLGTAFDASAITGLSGNCGGNTNITFTTGATQYWVGSTGSWSTAAEWGTSSGGSGGRTPLPQDDVVFDGSSFSAGSQTTTVDMPRSGKSVDFTAVTNSPTFTLSTTGGQTFYGSLTLVSGMTLSQSTNLTFEGRGNFTLTSAGKSFSQQVSASGFGGKLTLQDAFTCTDLSLVAGELDANDFNVTLSTAMSINGIVTRVLTMGNGTWTLSRTSGAVWALNNTGVTVNRESSTIAITNTGSSSKTFNGGGITYNNFSITASGTGAIIITGANTFNDFTIGAPKTVQYTAATTTTIQGTYSATGSAGNVITISSVTAATHTLSKASGTVSADYLNLTNSIATGGATWYAGANSTDSGGNTGWIFTAPPGAGWGTLLGLANNRLVQV